MQALGTPLGSPCMEPPSEDTSTSGLCENDILVDAINTLARGVMGSTRAPAQQPATQQEYEI